MSAQPVFVKRKYREGAIPKNVILVEEPSSVAQSAGDSGNCTTNATIPSSVDGRVRSGVRSLYDRLRIQPSPPSTPNDEPDFAEVELCAPASTSSTGMAPAGTAATSTSVKVRVEMLQVSVLIAMPSRDRMQKKDYMSRKSFDGAEEDDSEEPLPEMVFGVARMNYRHPSQTSGTTTPPMALSPNPTHVGPDGVVS